MISNRILENYLVASANTSGSTSDLTVIVALPKPLANNLLPSIYNFRIARCQRVQISRILRFNVNRNSLFFVESIVSSAISAIDCGGRYVISILKCFVTLESAFASASMYTVPGFKALTKPFLSTVAIVESLVDHNRLIKRNWSTVAERVRRQTFVLLHKRQQHARNLLYTQNCHKEKQK